jgi:predicted amidohydrolase YtcJ
MLHADLILVNGNIATMSYEQPRAQAVAVRDGKFVAVGTDKRILTYADENTRKIDLHGKFVVPGFIDAHLHGASLGRSFSQIDLRDVKSVKEIQQKVRQRAEETPKGQWIIGNGWDQERLAESRYPLRFDLDEVTPNHPVLLIRVCGHLGVVNSEALKLTGLAKKTETIEGGCIDIDPLGVPNGILRENALNLILGVLPKSTDEEATDVCLLACQKMVEEGITTAHWIVSSTSEMRVLQKLKERGLLPLRIYALIPIEYLNDLVELGLSTGFGDEKLRIGSAKILLDGSLGGRTAALKQPYNDSPNTKGMMLYTHKQLKQFAEKAHEANLQLAIHVIGDKAVETVLDTLEKILKKTSRADHRHRLEHASVLNPQLINRARKIGVVASVQPHFVVSDFWILSRLGKPRARWTYAFKSLLKAGVVLMGGSDAPVEPVSPVLGVYAAVARKANRQERLTVDEALRMYTVNAAYGSFEECLKGSIEVGKLADLTVLSHDLYKIPPQNLRGVKVEMTIVGGEVVYGGKK